MQVTILYQRTHMSLSLIEMLIEESQTTINHIIVNPEKFQAMLVSKRKNNIPKDLTISINDMNIKRNDSSKLLGIILDNKLNFEKHISPIFKYASCQLNILFRLKNFLGIKGRKVLIESFFYSSFQYFPLV